MDEVLEGDILLATFDDTDIRAVESSLEAQVLLGPAESLPMFADDSAESDFGGR